MDVALRKAELNRAGALRRLAPLDIVTAIRDKEVLTFTADISDGTMSETAGVIQFSLVRLIKTFQKEYDAGNMNDPSKVMKEVLGEVSVFSEGLELFDDITCTLLLYK